jgi:hypothetical protein
MLWSLVDPASCRDVCKPASRLVKAVCWWAFVFHWIAGTTGSAQDPAVKVQHDDLTESSGLAVSGLRPKHFWSHNDSGGKACLYAFDSDGNSTGKVTLKSAKADDWEDMAAYVEGGVSRLLVADCGDNQKRRDNIQVFLFDEPDPHGKTTEEKYQTITVSYADGPCDCEAVCVDLRSKQVLLVSKTVLPYAAVFAFPLPARETQATKTRVVAQRLTTLALPMVTSMDIDPSNGDIWIVSYVQAFRFARSSPEQTVVEQLSQVPTCVELPRWKQIEAVTIDPTSQLWLTSEGSPTKLGKLTTD